MRQCYSECSRARSSAKQACGRLAQLGEHHVRNVGVVGSNPMPSTKVLSLQSAGTAERFEVVKTCQTVRLETGNAFFTLNRAQCVGSLPVCLRETITTFASGNKESRFDSFAADEISQILYDLCVIGI
jgi:hypothetical protein